MFLNLSYRTNKIRWEYVVWYLIQVLSTITLTFIAFRRFVVEIFQTVGQEPFTPSSFILTLSGAVLVGAVSMFAGFYGLLHCWMNAFAEMLTFADRTFYKVINSMQSLFHFLIYIFLN